MALLCAHCWGMRSLSSAELRGAGERGAEDLGVLVFFSQKKPRSLNQGVLEKRVAFCRGL